MPPTPIVCKGLDHVVLRVTDIERSLRFYTGVLGLALERVIEDAGIYQLRCGRHMIDLCTLADDTTLAPPESRGVDHVCIMVEADIEEMLRHLESARVPVVMGPVELYGATGFGTSIYVLDPDKHKVELKTPRAEFPVRTVVADAKKTLSRPRD